jgi:ABC-type multidrug transport system fused ATPase/permease subunit
VLLRFHELDQGRATLAGHDLRMYAGDDVRRVIGLCAQDAHVLATSLLENVRLARPEGRQDDIAGAAARAGLMDWVRSLPLVGTLPRVTAAISCGAAGGSGWPWPAPACELSGPHPR